MPDGLNEEQQAAVDAKDGAVAVRAGAGAGKTRVLTVRAGELLSDGHGLLFVTFTRKASSEMSERLNARMGRLSRRQKRGISTMHSFVLNQIIKPLSDIGELGLISRRAGLRTARNGEARHFQETAFRELPSQLANHATLLELKARDVAAFMTQTNAWNCPQGKVSEDAAYNAALQSGSTLETAEWSSRALPLFAARYEQLCIDRNVIDFDQMILGASVLIHGIPDMQESLRQRFTHVQVDEFQDTNLSQLAVLTALCGRNGNCCVVGDDRQAIYGFRGATSGIYQSFINAFNDAKVLELNTNYRSTAEIVNVANDCASSMPSGSLATASDMVAGASKDGAPTPEHRVYATDVMEADELLAFAGTIPSGASLLFLYRNRFFKSELERALTEADIEYEILEDKSFFDNKEVAWTLDLAIAASDRSAQDGWLDTIDHVRLGLSKFVAGQMWGEGGLELILKNASSSKAKHELSEFLESLLSLTDAVKESESGTNSYMNKPDALKKRLRTYWDQYLEPKFAQTQPDKKNHGEGEGARLELARKRIDILLDMIQRNWLKKKNLRDAISGLSETSSQKGQETPQVTLSTIHGAKGLEADYVVVLAGGDVQADFDSLPEEERRVFYVAVTRPRWHLIVTSAENRPSLGKKKTKRVTSPYINELAGNIKTLDFTNGDVT